MSVPKTPASFARFGWVFPPCVLALLVLGFYSALIVSGSNKIMHTPDIRLYFHWLHTYIRDEIFAGRLPLWNPYNYCGMPFAGNPQATVFYPLSWLHLLMPVIQADKWMIVMHTWLAGVFMFMYLRLMNASRAAGLLGAIVYMFGGYMTTNAAVGHLTVLFTAAWLPLAMWCAERAVSAANHALMKYLALGLVMGIQFLAGEPQSSYYTSLLLGLYVVVRSMSWAKSEPTWIRRIIAISWALAGLMLAAIVAIGVAAVQVFPTVELAINSDRQSSNYEFATFGSFPPPSVIGLILPWSDGRIAGLGLSNTSLVIRQWWEFSCYLGILTLPLACMGFILRRRRELWAIRLAMFAAVILMFGRYTPIYPLLYEFVPGLDLFRIPARALLIVHWSLAAMAAFGFDHITEEASRRWRDGPWRALTISSIAFTLAMFIAGLQVLGLYWVADEVENMTRFSVQASLTEPRVLRAITCLSATLAMVIAFRWMTAPWARIAVIATIAADLCITAPGIPLVQFAVKDEPGYALLSSLRDRADAGVKPYRIDIPSYLATANLSMALRVENVNGYSPMAVARLFHYVHAMRGGDLSQASRHEIPDRLYRREDPFVVRLLNVWYSPKYSASTDQFFPATDVAALPRAWIVDQVEVIAHESATLARLTQPSFDPRRMVILGRPPQIDMKPGRGIPGNVTAKRISPVKQEFHTQSSRAGYLVLSEVFYPGWNATIDGKPVGLELANSLLTSLPLPSGTHTVALHYQPGSIKHGAVTTLVAVSLLTLAMFVANRQRLVRGARLIEERTGES